jgi:integrase
MTGGAEPRRRQRGSVEKLPSGSLRVKVYAGQDPVTKRRLYLDEVVSPGPKQAREAEQARTRLLNQVDERRNPKTRATVSQLVERYFEVINVDVQTMRGYRSKYDNHIAPLIGALSLGKLDVEVLDSFGAVLRTCRKHCGGQKGLTDHRTTRDGHVCDEHRGEPCSPPNPDACRACRRACKPHVCKGLGSSTIREIYSILSGALDRGITWKWIAVNPADKADRPSLPHPDPRPPTAAEAAQLINYAYSRDQDWGEFVWAKANLGTRRSELCALRWEYVGLEPGKHVVEIRQALYKDDDGVWRVKDTKTHQQRRIVPDIETAHMLIERHERKRAEAAAAGIVLSPKAFVYSPMPDGLTPMNPDTMTQRYDRMAQRFGIATGLKHLRHYNATELIAGGVDPRTVGGRLGHGGGGTTTLRVYTAWSAEADQRAAANAPVRMPPRPGSRTERGEIVTAAEVRARTEAHSEPYRRIAADIRGAISSGILQPGDPIPSEKELAARYGVAKSTAHRAQALLIVEGLVLGEAGKRRTVAPADGTGGGVSGRREGVEATNHVLR